MRTLAVTQNITADGSIEMITDWFYPQGRGDMSHLVDEYRLFVYPVVQGRGRRLMPDGAPAGDLRLIEARSFVSGIALLRYAYAGATAMTTSRHSRHPNADRAVGDCGAHRRPRDGAG